MHSIEPTLILAPAPDSETDISSSFHHFYPDELCIEHTTLPLSCHVLLNLQPTRIRLPPANGMCVNHKAAFDLLRLAACVSKCTGRTGESMASL